MDLAEVMDQHPKGATQLAHHYGKDLAEGDSRAHHYGKDLAEVRCVVAPASEGIARPTGGFKRHHYPTTPCGSDKLPDIQYKLLNLYCN